MTYQLTIDKQTITVPEDKIANVVLELNGGGYTEQQTTKTMLDLETLAKPGAQLTWRHKGKVVTISHKESKP